MMDSLFIETFITIMMMMMMMTMTMMIDDDDIKDDADCLVPDILVASCL